MKTVSINGRFLSQPITGMQRYAGELLRTLDGLLTEGYIDKRDVELEILTPPEVKPNIPLKTIKFKSVGHFSGRLWEQVELPRYCRGNLLFTPAGGAPVAHDHHLVTIPDASVFATPHAYSSAYVMWYRWLFRQISAKAHTVLTFSEFSKRDLERRCPIPAEKILVTHLGSEHIMREKSDDCLLRGFPREKPFVFAASSPNPNKNFRAIADAIHLLASNDISFVIAGRMNAKVFGRTARLTAGIVQLGPVSDGQLRALYQNALCFAFPSFYEGFGLPPLEAMACGCPVIVSGAASLPEVCGDAACYCDPNDPTDLARKIQMIRDNALYRQQLIQAGKARSGLFHWKKTAEQTWNAIMRSLASL